MFDPTIPLWLLLQGHSGPHATAFEKRTQLRCVVTAFAETPAPPDIGPAGIFDTLTGDLMLMDPLRDLVRGRMAILEAVAASLPGSEAVDDRISTLVTAKLGTVEEELPIE